MLNNKLIYITFLLTVITLSRCTDRLEIEPAQEISEDLALNSPENVQAVLVGAYDALGISDLFGGETLMHAELLGGDGEILWTGTFNAPKEIFQKNILTLNDAVSEVWLEAYEDVNIVNNVLSALDIVEDADEKARTEGEAKFIRAMLYFELVRFYGSPYQTGDSNSQLAVPIVLSPTRGISEENQLSRNTVEEVYTQIVDDLSDAVSMLPESNGFFATSNAAKALLARVYLTMGNYTAARDLANEVIISVEFILVSEFADAFNRDGNSSEDIFAMQVTAQDQINQLNTFFATQEFGGRNGDIDILPAHLALYPEGDARGAFFYEGESDGAIHTAKFTNQFGNIPILRLAEMYLIRAEANFREGTAVGATPLEDINALRTRAGSPLFTAITLDDITNERRLELAFEGHKIHDIKRLQQSVGGFAYDAEELVFPIPAREITVNPMLEQNDGY